MEPELVPYSPILHRPPLRWPNGARVAVWVVPNIEHYEYLPKYVRTRDPWPRSPHPDVLGYAARDYGNRVGLWRLFRLTDEFRIRCTVSLNMTVIQHYPAILEAMEQRGWEYMSHGIYNTRYHWDFSEAEERAAMLESRAIHRALTGREQRGWFSPAITNTLRTFDLAAECGYDYTADLYHDDQPFPLRVKRGKLLSMPYSVDLNDVILHRRGEEVGDFVRQIRDYFDTVYEEGAEQGRVMCIALHPYWVGQPHRIRVFRAALEYILSHPGVWVTTGAEIADWYNAQHLPAIEAHLAALEAANGLVRPVEHAPHRRSARARHGPRALSVPHPAGRAALRLAGRCAHHLHRDVDAGLLGAGTTAGCERRSPDRLAAGEILPRLADLEPSRIRCARRHLPRAGRAGPVRRDAERGARIGGGTALPGTGGRTDVPQRLLPGARQPRDSPHHQPDERGRGTRVHRRGARCGGGGDRRGAARLVRPGLQPIGTHPGAAR